jgi:hypothetical protein
MSAPTYTTALAATIHQEVMSAMRAGMPITTVIAALGAEIERLQIALPYVAAHIDSERAPG